MQRWEFLYSSSADPITYEANDHSWEGQMVAGGVVRVTFSVNGQPHMLTRNIQVTRRSWNWLDRLSARRGQPGEIDRCMAFNAGLSAAIDCSFVTDLVSPSGSHLPGRLSEAFQMAVVPQGGPNAGLWYIKQVTARIELISQLHKTFRTDGDRRPDSGALHGDSAVIAGCLAHFGNTAGRNHVTVNTVCAPKPDFSAFQNAVWIHEDEHNRLSLAAARLPQYDIHRLLELLVEPSEASLLESAIARYRRAERQISEHANPEHIGWPKHNFDIWSFSYNGGWLNTVVELNVPPS